MIFSASRVFVVVTMDFGMTLKADRDCVRDVIRTTFRAGHDMIDLHLDATKAMADAATPVAFH